MSWNGAADGQSVSPEAPGPGCSRVPGSTIRTPSQLGGCCSMRTLPLFQTLLGRSASDSRLLIGLTGFTHCSMAELAARRLPCMMDWAEVLTNHHLYQGQNHARPGRTPA